MTEYYIYDNEMNKWLGIEEEDRCLGIFYVGHPAEGEPWPKGRRTSIEPKVEWIED